MYDSILITIKKMLGLAAEDDSFDVDVITHINTIFMIVKQLGICPDNFYITGEDEKWSDFIQNDADLIPIKTLVYARTKLIFDPPASSTLMQALKDTADELEFRLRIEEDK